MSEPLPMIVGELLADDAVRAATVLVVDDDDALRALYRARLTAAGYDVLQASDARHAFVVSRACHVDAVLLDVGLPTATAGACWPRCATTHTSRRRRSS